MGTLTIKPRSRIFHGHDWVYTTEVANFIGQPEDGSVVTLKDPKGRSLGSAIYNSKSQIIARRFSRHRQKLDEDFFVRRIQQALEYRQRRNVAGNAFRVVWSESDGLPGVIIDQYGPVVVVQTLTLAMDLALPLLTAAILKVLQPSVIIERNDAPVRRAEGMELRSGLLYGDDPGAIDIQMASITFKINPLHGHKTGFYLDQAHSYATVAEHAKNARVLDCFSNQGAFALFSAAQGASEVVGVEISHDLVQLCEENAAQNQLKIQFHEANAFDFLKKQEQAGEKYDLIILDPPSFTRSKGKRDDAMRGYKELHLRALKMLTPAGKLATFCCSHHVSEQNFMDSLVSASVDAHRLVRLLQRFNQAPDHPVLPHIPETEYLKGFLVEAMPAR